jgi:DNA-binding MarR family transcriptional regulator
LLPTRFLIRDTRKTTLVLVFHILMVGDSDRTWTFLTSHAHILVCIANDPSLRLRDIGDRVGITERVAHQIVSQLADGG